MTLSNHPLLLYSSIPLSSITLLLSLKQNSYSIKDTINEVSDALTRYILRHERFLKTIVEDRGEGNKYRIKSVKKAIMDLQWTMYVELKRFASERIEWEPTAFDQTNQLVDGQSDTFRLQRRRHVIAYKRSEIIMAERR